MTLKGMRKADQQVILDGSFGTDGVPPATATSGKEPIGTSAPPLPESGPLGAARLAVPNFETNTRCVIHASELAVRRELASFDTANASASLDERVLSFDGEYGSRLRHLCRGGIEGKSLFVVPTFFCSRANLDRSDYFTPCAEENKQR